MVVAWHPSSHPRGVPAPGPYFRHPSGVQARRSNAVRGLRQALWASLHPRLRAGVPPGRPRGDATHRSSIGLVTNIFRSPGRTRGVLPGHFGFDEAVGRWQHRTVVIVYLSHGATFAMASRILWNVFPIGLCLAILLTSNCSSTKPNLTPIPLDELKRAPFDYSRRSEYSTRRLIDYIQVGYLNWHWNTPDGQDEEVDWEIRDVLWERKSDRDIAEMVHAYRTTEDSTQRKSLSLVLRCLDDPRITQAYREAMTRTDLGPDYWGSTTSPRKATAMPSSFCSTIARVCSAHRGTGQRQSTASASTSTSPPFPISSDGSIPRT